MDTGHDGFRFRCNVVSNEVSKSINISDSSAFRRGGATMLATGIRPPSKPTTTGACSLLLRNSPCPFSAFALHLLVCVVHHPSPNPHPQLNIPSDMNLLCQSTTDSVGSLGRADLLAVLVVSHTWWGSTVAATFPRADTILRVRRPFGVPCSNPCS